jgi:4-amino-4-deoxy-L-arabinose transferase-like glycosyltransferase
MAMWHSTPALPRTPPKSGPRGELGIFPVIAAAFFVRLWAASGTFLNPDEALHFLVANKTSWPAAYKASLSTAHPPGLIFLLYFWRWLGTSEIALRLPSVIAGTFFCWFSFRWLKRAFNRNVAWIGFLFASSLPPMVALSAEVRQYAFLLMFMAAAMDLLEQALAERSALKMLGSGLCLCFALAFHYSALLFAAAFAIYVLLRILKQPTEPGVLAAWAIGQLSALALFTFFYFHHIAKLYGNEMAQQTMQGWLANSYYHPGKQSLALFVFARTFGVFQFVFGQLAVGDIAALLFLAAVVILIRRRNPTLASFLLLPFSIACGLAVAGKYPYGGTRHSGFLVPFVLAGVAVTISALAKDRIQVSGLIALTLVALSAAFGAPHRPYMTRADQSSLHMQRATDFVHANVKPEQEVVVDYQTSLLLGHYLCDQRPMVFDTSVAGFEEFQCNGLRVIAIGPQVQIFTQITFLDPRLWTTLGDHFGVRRSDQVWVVQAGWDIHLAEQLKGAGYRDLKPETFGKNIEIFPFAVPGAR